MKMQVELTREEYEQILKDYVINTRSLDQRGDIKIEWSDKVSARVRLTYEQVARQETPVSPFDEGN